MPAEFELVQSRAESCVRKDAGLFLWGAAYKRVAMTRLAGADKLALPGLSLN